MRFLLGLAAILLGFSLTGCGSSARVGDEQSEAPTFSKSSPEQGTPASAVNKFLSAVKAGDDEGAAQMLTVAARQKTAEYEMVVAPPGSDTASFKVGEVETIGEEGAHVASFWTDIDAEGNKHTDTIVWMLRKEGTDWRIAGMATRLAENQPAVVLNFEEPEEMLERQHALESQLSDGSNTSDENATGESEMETAERRPNTLRDGRR